MPILKLQPEWLLGDAPQIKDYVVSSGSKGNLQTVALMSKLAHARKAHPRVRTLALNILNEFGINSMNYIDEAKAIGTYVQRKLIYVRDADGVEQVHDPLTLIDQLERGVARADCDDMALLVATLLLSIGHRPMFRMVRYTSNFGPFNHIYVVDYTRNYNSSKQRLPIDAIIKDKLIGFEVPHKSGKEIEV